jgi:hypothetical protein
MTMFLRVEDMNHVELDRLRDGGDTFARLCQRIHRDAGTGWRVLTIVDPHSDTMLNRVQQLMLRSELAEIRQRPDLLADAGPLVEQLSAALERSLKIGGYLTFVAD